MKTPCVRENTTILLIEDNIPSQMLYKEIILRMGFNCLIRSTAKEALELIASQALQIHLILMDIGLPYMNGVTCMQHIRSQYSHMDDVPIIAITAHVMTYEIEDFEKKGFEKVLQKPIKREQFINIIKQFLHEEANND